MKISSQTGTYVLELQPSHVEALLDELGEFPRSKCGPNVLRFYRELQAHVNLRADSRSLARQQEGRA